MQTPDTLQRFLFEHANIRGEIVHLNDAYKAIMSQHPYPEAVKKLLGEALVACVLLSGSIKFEGEISLQFNGDERLPFMIIQCDNLLNVRAYAKYKEANDDKHPIDYLSAFLKGKMVLTINQYKSTQAYQSIVPIESSHMGENLMQYFAQSEQLSTHVWLATDKNKASGMLLQLLPGEETEEREQFWEYAVHLGQTITDKELLTLDNQTILHRLYHETELRLFEERTLRFRCQCSKEKMKNVLKILGEADLNALIQERGNVEARCDFCNKAYVFDAIDVTLLFK